MTTQIEITKSKEEEIFSKTIACVVANRLAIQYNGYMVEIFKEAGLTFLADKCAEAEKAGVKLISKMMLKAKSIDDQASMIADYNSNLIADITALPLDKQMRVQKLVQKLHKENKTPI